MEYTFFCTHCGQKISADISVSGTVVSCPACLNDFAAPFLAGSKPIAATTPEHTSSHHTKSKKLHWALRVGGYLGGAVIIFAAFVVSGEERSLGAGAMTFGLWTLGLTVFRYPHWRGTPKALILDSALKGALCFVAMRLLVAGNFVALLLGGVYLAYRSWRTARTEQRDKEKGGRTQVSDENSKWAW